MAITTHLSHTAEKVRLYGLTTNILQVFAHTSRFRDSYYSSGVTIPLPVATQGIAKLLFYALVSLELEPCSMLRQGYSKAGGCGRKNDLSGGQRAGMSCWW